MSSPVPRLFSSVPSLAVRTANDGKLDVAWGMRRVISDSMYLYKLSCVHVPQAA